MIIDSRLRIKDYDFNLNSLKPNPAKTSSYQRIIKNNLIEDKRDVYFYKK